jgi:hypothetical protein
MTDERRPPTEPRSPPKEARCAACGGWITTVPAGTAWARGRCYNRTDGRNCKLYGQGQTVHLR